jgi:hypothetical protein
LRRRSPAASRVRPAGGGGEQQHVAVGALVARVAAEVDGVSRFWVSFRLDEQDEEEYWLIASRISRPLKVLAIVDKHPVLQTIASVYPYRGLTRLTVTFKVLADLSQRTQVLFLTHDEHLLDVAEASIGAGAYRAHHLSP